MARVFDVVEGPSGPIEPCAQCGEETAVGTVLFGGRHDLVGEDGTRLYLCDECYAVRRAAAGGEPPSESDAR